jgi:hypothetical protein
VALVKCQEKLGHRLAHEYLSRFALIKDLTNR